MATWSPGAGSAAGVTLAIASGPAGGRLWGTTIVEALGGVATFNDLSIDRAGSYTLTASTRWAWAAAKSAAFNTTLVVTSCTMKAAGGVSLRLRLAGRICGRVLRCKRHKTAKTAVGCNGR